MSAEFNEQNFHEEVLGSDQPVLVDFWSHGWPPCRKLGPVIDELATDNDGNAKVGKVDVGSNMGLAQQYGVTGVPTIMVFKGGEVVAKQVGAVPKAHLQEMIDQAASA